MAHADEAARQHAQVPPAVGRRRHALPRRRHLLARVGPADDDRVSARGARRVRLARVRPPRVRGATVPLQHRHARAVLRARGARARPVPLLRLRRRAAHLGRLRAQAPAQRGRRRRARWPRRRRRRQERATAQAVVAARGAHCRARIAPLLTTERAHAGVDGGQSELQQAMVRRAPLRPGGAEDRCGARRGHDAQAQREEARLGLASATCAQRRRRQPRAWRRRRRRQ
mmetsp:Transcript_55638/g.136558  ORF Transcript_55638/g.136558 Transcript_55638/m.136558 type:complete len:228 (+) Transcript_55638:701-1384(+)